MDIVIPHQFLSFSTIVVLTLGLTSCGHAEWTAYNPEKGQKEAQSSDQNSPIIRERRKVADTQIEPSAPHTGWTSTDPGRTVKVSADLSSSLETSKADRLPEIRSAAERFSTPPIEWTPVQVRVQSDEEEINEDVDRLLRQNNDWYPTIHRNSPLSNVVTDSTQTQSYLGELHGLIRAESAPVATQPIKLSGHLIESMTVPETSPSQMKGSLVFLDELKELVEDGSITDETRVVVPSKAETNVQSTALPFEEIDVPSIPEPEILINESPVSPVPAASVDVDEEVEVVAQAYNPPAVPPTPEDSEKLQTLEEDEARYRLSNLFAPVTDIDLEGPSTEPPKDIADFTTPQSNPESRLKTEAYLATATRPLSPAYFVGPTFSAVHPPRNTYCFTHNPLYFEDPNLERCGIGCGCFTTVKSAACFYADAVFLPYTLIVTPPRTCMPTLGDCPTCCEFDSDAYFREWKW
ncbi:hypothetical protein KOR42_40160 [Thalassoglobus neptunius]|uniref:Uncharacterized protein n=1 Tax=Thalassoglobus neptunius TaxID=1938619 RepID=A0A5C5WDV8_9PLAN|nr:hypothetical protein [Thalassoglobus neptunius]TWT48225.1 hypothetical protein KOR42_40160 [Thalassoglobus neptunius]